MKTSTHRSLPNLSEDKPVMKMILEIKEICITLNACFPSCFIFHGVKNYSLHLKIKFSYPTALDTELH